MRRLRSAILFAILFNNIVQAGELKSLWGASRAERYVPVTTEELAHAEQLFMHMFAGKGDDPQVSEAWAALGFNSVSARVGKRRYSVVHESGARRDGRGFFVFATRPTSDDVLQAPHAYADRHTGTIALQFMRSGRFSGLAMNTVPRRYEIGGKTFGADMAHLEHTYLIAFSRAAARSKTTGRVFQLHGFSAQKRAAGPASEAQIIVSSGTRRPRQYVYRTVSCLRALLGNKALLYPRDVRQLGGTHNRIGQTLRAMGYDGFLHLEMEYALRQALRKDRTLRTRVLDCLQIDGG